MEHFIDAFKKYADFSGRATRKQYLDVCTVLHDYLCSFRCYRCSIADICSRSDIFNGFIYSQH